MYWRHLVEWFQATTFSPDSRFTRIWQDVILVLSVCVALVYPYVACFEAYETHIADTGKVP